MAKLQVRFSAAELMLILQTMKIAPLLSLEQSSLQALTEDKLKGALTASRDSLVARGLARTGDDGGLELHPLVLAAVGVTVRPEAGFWLSIIKEGSKPLSTYFNWTRRIIIKNWMDREEVHCFEQVKDKDSIAREILKQSRIDPSETGDEGKGYVVPAFLLKQIIDEQNIKDTQLAELHTAGISDEDIEVFLNAIVHPMQRSILVAVPNMRDQSQTARSVFWIVGEGHRWLITEHNSGSDTVALRLASGADIFQAVSDLVTDVIDITLEQD
jgi:hypothetical protein